MTGGHQARAFSHPLFRQEGKNSGSECCILCMDTRKACQPQVAHALGEGGVVCAGMQCACISMSGCAGPCPSAWGLVPPFHHAP